MTKNLLLILFVFFLYNASFSQSDCVVKLKSIIGKYEGECKKGFANGLGEAKGEFDIYKGNFKKGLPHGQGIYTWGNGNIYSGNFSKGKMDGKGKLVVKEDLNVLKIREGYFKDGEYIGTYKYATKVISKREIRKIVFQEDNLNLGKYNQIVIKVKYLGKFIHPNLTISDVNNTPYERIISGVKLINVKFPLKKISVSFIYNGFSCYSVFEINKKNDWEVIIHI